MKAKNISQVLPKGDKEIIKDALIQYQRTLDCLIDKFEREGNGDMVDQLHHSRFDLFSLIGFMNYDVTINLPQYVKDNFVFKHSVDFPLYVEKDCKLQYPIEEESKWVTILTGDFTFVDDGVHGRECHVKEIYTIEKYLREDLNGVIDDIKNTGYKFIVVEDYDGSIEMIHPKKEKDEREFQVVWLETHYSAKTKVVPFSYFNETRGFDEDIPFIDDLKVSESRTSDGVIVIRLK